MSDAVVIVFYGGKSRAKGTVKLYERTFSNTNPNKRTELVGSVLVLWVFKEVPLSSIHLRYPFSLFSVTLGYQPCFTNM